MLKKLSRYLITTIVNSVLISAIVFGILTVINVTTPMQHCRTQVLQQLHEEAAFRRALRSASAEAEAEDFITELTKKGAKQ